MCACYYKEREIPSSSLSINVRFCNRNKCFMQCSELLLQQHFRGVLPNSFFGKCLFWKSFCSASVGCVPATLIRVLRHRHFTGCFPKFLITLKSITFISPGSSAFNSICFPFFTCIYIFSLLVGFFKVTFNSKIWHVFLAFCGEKLSHDFDIKKLWF